MKNVAYTLEDLLEILVGLKGHDTFQIEPTDRGILQSMGKQVFKGTALTDRQYDVVRQNILKYKDQFTALEYNIDLALESLRMPIRQIDRSRWIKVILQDKVPSLAIRFIFNKKYIERLAAIKSSSQNEYTYDKEDKIHYFQLSEKNVYNIIKEFKDCDFVIDPDLMNLYTKIESIIDNPEQYVPGIYNYKIKNVNGTTQDYIKELLGEPTQENLYMFRDRKEMLGLYHIDEEQLNTSMLKLDSLTKKIIQRKNTKIRIDREEHVLNSVMSSLQKLSRFPLLVVLGDDPLKDLIEVNEALNGWIDTSDMSVIFRLENDEYGKSFNEYIRDNGLNNRLDKNTKVVYTSKRSKINKPLIKSGWIPDCCFAIELNHYESGKLSDFVNQTDLVIYYDSKSAPWGGYSKKIYLVEKI